MNDTVIECVIEWIKGDKTVSVTMPAGTRLYNRINKLCENEENAKRCSLHINKDRSMFATIPEEWVKISPKRAISEEQRKRARKLGLATQAKRRKPRDSDEQLQEMEIVADPLPELEWMSAEKEQGISNTWGTQQANQKERSLKVTKL